MSKFLVSNNKPCLAISEDGKSYIDISGQKVVLANDDMKVTFRGWAGHFICADRCRFRLNTLIELGETRVVVSTVGLMEKFGRDEEFDTIGHNRHFETVVFHAKFDGTFWDADVEREIGFVSEFAHLGIDKENEANAGHYAVVEEIKQKIISGIIK